MKTDITQGAVLTNKGPLVLLYYDGFEWQLRHGAAGRTYAQARRFARYAYRTLRRKQVRTGFYTCFLALWKSLEEIGCDVRVNDYRLAEKYPHYPVGVAGYPSVLGKVPQGNPIIFGPGDFGMPEDSVKLFDDPQYAKLTLLSDWFCDIYRPFCGDKLLTWSVGIDTKAWPDMSRHVKDLDCVIYDKIRWDRERLVPELLEKIQSMLRERGLSYSVLRYGFHHQMQFRHEIERAKSLIFLCEHETQGLAYQEAMSSNVPVFAWDEGRIADPCFAPYVGPEVAVSSVPYFSDACGIRFKLADVEPSFDRFWSQLPNYRPRDYVASELSMKQSAENYLRAYLALGKRAAVTENAIPVPLV